MMDFVKPEESFAMWPQMITQKRVPDVLYLHDQWLPDGGSGEGRNRYHINMFLSNMTPWSPGEGTHTVCKRLCPWRCQIKYRISATSHFDLHYRHYLSSVWGSWGLVICIPISRKAGRRGKPGSSHPDGSWIFAAHKPWQNPLQESQWEPLLGQTQPSGAESLLSSQGMFRWCGKGAASAWVSRHARGAWPSYVFRLAWGASAIAVQAASQHPSMYRKCHSQRSHRAGKY